VLVPKDWRYRSFVHLRGWVNQRTSPAIGLSYIVPEDLKRRSFDVNLNKET
jgi:hypothetical protein